MPSPADFDSLSSSSIELLPNGSGDRALQANPLNRLSLAPNQRAAAVAFPMSRNSISEGATGGKRRPMPWRLLFIVAVIVCALVGGALAYVLVKQANTVASANNAPANGNFDFSSSSSSSSSSTALPSASFFSTSSSLPPSPAPSPSASASLSASRSRSRSYSWSKSSTGAASTSIAYPDTSSSVSSTASSSAASSVSHSTSRSASLSKSSTGIVSASVSATPSSSGSSISSTVSTLFRSTSSTGLSLSSSGSSRSSSMSLSSSSSLSPSSSCSSVGSTILGLIITNAADSYVENRIVYNSCPMDTAYGQVAGVCYAPFAIQVNAYGKPPASVNFTMWSQSAGCWGIVVTQPANPGFVYWNSPLATRGFSFGVNALLTAAGGIQVATLNQQYQATAPCVAGSLALSVCVHWSVKVPGVLPSSFINTVSTTMTNWDALIDIYFHHTATPTAGLNTAFDLQIYQMVMDWANGAVPNWATYIVGTHATKTISGVTYMVSVNMGDPGTEGAGWVGNGGTLNSVSMFPLPTYPTSGSSGSGSYLWGVPSATHDVGGIIAWLSQTATVGANTGILDDQGNYMWDNVRAAQVTQPLIKTTDFLTGFNPGFEVIQANPGATKNYPNNINYITDDLWIALPGEIVKS